MEVWDQEGEITAPPPPRLAFRMERPSAIDNINSHMVCKHKYTEEDQKMYIPDFMINRIKKAGLQLMQSWEHSNYMLEGKEEYSNGVNAGRRQAAQEFKAFLKAYNLL